MPRHARGASPVAWRGDRDDVKTLLVLVWVPRADQGRVRKVCRGFDVVVGSDAFRRARAARGRCEYGVVCAGGWDERAGVFASTWMLVGRRWHRAAPMRDARAFAPMVTLGNEVVVLGGVDSNMQDTRTVDAYDPRTDAWRALAPLPRALSQPVAGVVGGRVIVVGAPRGERVRGMEYVPDQHPPTWRDLPPLPADLLPSWCATLAWVGTCQGKDALFVLCTKTCVFVAYCDGVWTRKADLPAREARVEAAGIVVDGDPVLVGGRWCHDEEEAGDVLPRLGVTTTAVRYRVDEDAWERDAEHMLPRTTFPIGQVSAKIDARQHILVGGRGSDNGLIHERLRGWREHDVRGVPDPFGSMIYGTSVHAVPLE